MLVQNSLSEVLRAREELFSRTIWTDPTSQLQNRVKGEELSRYFLLTESERIGIQQTIRLLVSTTPYYLSLSDPSDPNCPIRRMIVPTADEAVFSLEESSDPLDEERLSPVRGLTHM
ncbi:MAG: KamA family radical SAM protein, partial [Leptospira sp.]|nr:KamA family radical SAM protein [Leptospira sp.]